MSTLLEVVPTLGRAGQLHHGHVVLAVEGAEISVQLSGTVRTVSCQMLLTGGAGLTLSAGDEVLVWMPDMAGGQGVVLGRTGVYEAAPVPVVPRDAFEARPQSLVLESQGDLVLRNGHAKISLGADGNVEIVCSSFTTRCQRLMRLLAPLIKLN